MCDVWSELAPRLRDGDEQVLNVSHALLLRSQEVGFALFVYIDGNGGGHERFLLVVLV